MKNIQNGNAIARPPDRKKKQQQKRSPNQQKRSVSTEMLHFSILRLRP